MPGKPAPGFFSRILTNLAHRSRVRKQQDTFVGEDEHGNRYFERLADETHMLKAQRRVEPTDDDQFKVPTVPVEWMTWLQHRRKEPPTPQEREQNYVAMIVAQQRAKQLEEKRMLDEPSVDRAAAVSQHDKKTSFPRYADYDEIVKEAEHGINDSSHDTSSKK